MLQPLLLVCSALLAAPLQGQVVDEAGRPVAQARVFFEAGLGAALIEALADDQGRFAFSNLPAGGGGVFAIATGRSFGGRHLSLTPGEQPGNLTLVLRPPGKISGKIEDVRGKAIEGARITGAVLTGDPPVGIPFGKLKAFGIEEPVSDRKGRFSIENLPIAGRVHLKIGHPQYAQEGVSDLAVGESGLKITMYEGTVVKGAVRQVDDGANVPAAVVVVRNAQPPHDTAVAQADAAGEYLIRLKPGVYMYQAVLGTSRSPGWEKITVTGHEPQIRANAVIAPAAAVLGSIKDARTGAPLEGVRLTLEAGGAASAITRTGPTGEFYIEAAAGECTLRIVAAPGYLPPETPALKLQLAPGEKKLLPGMWLAPIPPHRVQIVADELGTPLPLAVVTLLNPPQFGWHIADEQGNALLHVGAIPEDQRLIGFAEDPSGGRGAVFALEAGQREGRVQVLPLASIRGRAVDDKGNGISGVVLASILAQDDASDKPPTTLWRTVTADDGRFTWPAVSAGVPQYCVLYGDKDGQATSRIFSPAPGAVVEVGDIVVSGAMAAKSLLGSRLEWRSAGQICGPAPVGADYTLVFYADAPDAATIAGGLVPARAALDPLGIQPVLAVRGGGTCADPTLPQFAGEAPATATSYLVDGSGVVRLETFGLPPLSALR